jgi:hypothetical protein
VGGGRCPKFHDFLPNGYPSGTNQTDDSRGPFSSSPRKRGPRAAVAGSAALDARFRGHDGEEAWVPNVRSLPLVAL